MRSSKDTKLFGIHDAMSQNLWSDHFIHNQGYISKTNLHQENITKVMLEQNRK